MGQSLTEIAQSLRDTNKKVQLIYAFNGVGKTRLSRAFKELISPKSTNDESEEHKIKVLYYSRRICSIGIMIWMQTLTGNSKYNQTTLPIGCSEIKDRKEIL